MVEEDVVVGIQAENVVQCIGFVMGCSEYNPKLRPSCRRRVFPCWVDTIPRGGVLPNTGGLSGLVLAANVLGLLFSGSVASLGLVYVRRQLR